MVAVHPEIKCVRRARSTRPVCNCPRCSEQRNYVRRQIDYGRYRRISAETANAELDRLMSLGYDGPAIATAVGVPINTGHDWVQRRRQGKMMRLGAKTCQMIMDAGQPTQGRVGGHYPLIAQRKLRALARLGYGVHELGRMMADQGLWRRDARAMLKMYRSGHGPNIRVQLLIAINTVYRQLRYTPAPDDTDHNRVRKYAADKRWASPLHWADINDPDCEPDSLRKAGQKWDYSRHADDVDPIAVDLLVAGHTQGIKPTTAERAEVVRILRQRGMCDRDIYRLTGIGASNRRYPKQQSESEQTQ